MTPQPTGTHIQPQISHTQTVKGKRITVMSPALERWQIALILGVSEKTIIRKEKAGKIIRSNDCGVIRYPAEANGVGKYIDLVSDPDRATTRP